jgi:3-hydroxyacyl-CoA dehydrogenase
VGIAGTGQIACGLAVAAAGGREVVMWGRSPESASRARETLGERGASVRIDTDLDALASSTFVLEAIVEDHQAKAALLGDLGRCLPADCVLGTTTSSLSVQSLAGASGRADRFVGFHVFNPVHRMRLVELAFPSQAAQSTRARALALCQALDKTAVEVPPDAPGFVVNRLLFPFLFDAVRLMESSGLGPQDIDECMRLGAGHPMGPLALLDFVGLDVALAIGEALQVEVPQRLRDLVDQGDLGRKSGRGLLSYD